MLFSVETVAQTPNIQGLLKKMESAYAQVTDYQAKMEVRTYSNDHSSKTEKFLYTFKKPKKIRLDIESPHPGMILVYPDHKGKVGFGLRAGHVLLRSVSHRTAFCLKSPQANP